MLELNISQNKVANSKMFGKWYARVEYKKTMGIDEMAEHMAEHNTPFSVGTIKGILTDFVKCTREQCLMGNTVKIDNLAIFKCTVEANGLRLAQGYKVNCGLGSIPKKGPDGTGDPDFTKQAQYAIGSAKLLAQATGEFTKKELNDDSTFRWTKKAAEVIDGFVSSLTPDPSLGGEGSDNTGGSNTGGNEGGNTGGDNGGGDNGGDDNGGLSMD